MLDVSINMSSFEKVIFKDNCIVMQAFNMFACRGNILSCLTETNE